MEYIVIPRTVWENFIDGLQSYSNKPDTTTLIELAAAMGALGWVKEYKRTGDTLD